MKAIVMNSFGGPDVLHAEERPRPVPQAGEVLIRVSAASVNPVDYKIRSGNYRKTVTELPAVPGRDVSGIVAALGAGVTGLNIGDEVYAFLAAHSGGYADYAIGDADEVALKPRTLDHLHAAAVPLAAVTAWQALFDHGHLKAGQRVLIHGAAGGVGHFAVQFAKAKGGIVFATASGRDISVLQQLGADQVIDHRAKSFEHEVREIDLVVDLVGGDTQRRSWQVIKPGGALVSTLEPPSAEEAARRQARGEVFMASPTRATLTEIANLIDAGKVRVIIQKTYRLEDAAQAQDELEHEHSAGKRVLVTG